ncbi:MAG TPA: ROK family protein [Enterococcus columbae]|nr:ROK family protein [Enterococcus columbae]
MNILTLDIGGNFIKYALINEHQQMIGKSKVSTPTDTLEHLYSVIDDIFVKFENVEGLAISMPGVIDSEQGIAHTGGFLKYIQHLPLSQQLSQKYHLPVWIGNDAKCAGYAEVGYGVLQDVDDALVVILGTAIGGCIIQNKKVRQGKHFAAGEVSNLLVDYHDVDERWFMQGGKDGLLSIVQKYLSTEKDYTGEEIFDLLIQGDEKVNEALDRYAKNLAIQIFNLQVVLDVEKIAIGGGISAQNILIEKINQQFSPLFASPDCCIEQVPIVACKYRNDANLLGAFYQFTQINS